MAMQASPLPEMVLFRTMALSLDRWSMMPALRLSMTTLFWMLTSLHRLEAIMPWSPVVVIGVGDIGHIDVAMVGAVVVVPDLFTLLPCLSTYLAD